MDSRKDCGKDCGTDCGRLEKLPQLLQSEGGEQAMVDSLVEQDKIYAEIDEAYRKIMADPELMYIYEGRMKARLDRNSMMGEARDDGKAEGKADGLAEGEVIGIEKGKVIGIAEGEGESCPELEAHRCGSGYHHPDHRADEGRGHGAVEGRRGLYPPGYRFSA